MTFFTPIIPIQPMDKIGAAQPVEQVQQKKNGFGAMLENAIKDLEAAQAQSAEDTGNLALGQVDNLAQVQINAMKASTMLQTTVQLTSRAVGAYKEIMQMQI